ncbi:hypothetical protein NL676_031503 [Syzygium grande]|nr:hypothetical protein NL676_031503 [Syzygium grande]
MEPSDHSPTASLLDPPVRPIAPAAASKKLALLPLVFLIYFEVAGGPYGEESAVGAAGPLFAILGFVAFPFIWSIPEALVTAELATAFPGNGGYVIWAHRAFGPFWGSLLGSWKFLCGVINLASYPALCMDYLKLVFSVFASGVPRYVAIFLFTSVLSFMNYTGLSIVGYTAVGLGIVSLSPFVVLTLFAIPKIDPKRWISLGELGKLRTPQRTYPRALFSAGLLACLAYLVPLLAALGAIPLDQEDWVDGYFADAGELIAGEWLKIWIEIGAVLSFGDVAGVRVISLVTEEIARYQEAIQSARANAGTGEVVVWNFSTTERVLMRRSYKRENGHHLLEWDAKTAWLALAILQVDQPLPTDVM